MGLYKRDLAQTFMFDVPVTAACSRGIPCLGKGGWWGELLRLLGCRQRGPGRASWLVAAPRPAQNVASLGVRGKAYGRMVCWLSCQTAAWRREARLLKRSRWRCIPHSMQLSTVRHGCYAGFFLSILRPCPCPLVHDLMMGHAAHTRGRRQSRACWDQ